jgi:ABC-type glycerol-3-phosphate transport system permease component
VALTHDPDAERVYLDKGVFGDYRKVMFNDFVIAGPAADPARAREAATAADAMSRIAASGHTFASRADTSGTHSRELLLWKQAGRKPLGPKVIETGQGMAPTLRIASERQSYVLTDRATYRQLESTLRLVILNEAIILLNTYAASYRRGLTGDRLHTPAIPGLAGRRPPRGHRQFWSRAAGFRSGRRAAPARLPAICRMFADLLHALRLIVTADREVWQITAVSLQVSLTALFFATLVSLPLGYAISSSRSRMAGVATWLIHTATAFPTVVVGLTFYFLLSQSGPLGWMNLLSHARP